MFAPVPFFVAVSLWGLQMHARPLLVMLSESWAATTGKKAEVSQSSPPSMSPPEVTVPNRLEAPPEPASTGVETTGGHSAGADLSVMPGDAAVATVVDCTTAQPKADVPVSPGTSLPFVQLSSGSPPSALTLTPSGLPVFPDTESGHTPLAPVSSLMKGASIPSGLPPVTSGETCAGDSAADQSKVETPLAPGSSKAHSFAAAGPAMGDGAMATAPGVHLDNTPASTPAISSCPRPDAHEDEEDPAMPHNLNQAAAASQASSPQKADGESDQVQSTGAGAEGGPFALSASGITDGGKSLRSLTPTSTSPPDLVLSTRYRPRAAAEAMFPFPDAQEAASQSADDSKPTTLRTPNPLAAHFPGNADALAQPGPMLENTAETEVMVPSGPILYPSMLPQVGSDGSLWSTSISGPEAAAVPRQDTRPMSAGNLASDLGAAGLGAGLVASAEWSDSSAEPASALHHPLRFNVDGIDLASPDNVSVGDDFHSDEEDEEDDADEHAQVSFSV